MIVEKVEGAQASALSRYRVLDLTNEKGMMCGRILSDMGIEVTKVEAPGGDPSRNIGPFYHNKPDPEKSLFWFALNLNKRGITLNLNSEDGRHIFMSLLPKTDIVIESFPVGLLGQLGLGYDELSRVNRQLIMASITGFGQTGPYKDFKAPDIICMAMGGEMNLTGEPDRPPLRVGVPQAYLHTGAEAATACLAALWHREMTGEGQYIDVSAQECVAGLGFYNMPVWDLFKKNIKRQGGHREIAGVISFRFLFPVADGYVAFLALGGETRAESQRRLIEWMDKEGMADDFIKQFDWDSYNAAGLTPEVSKKLENCFRKFFLTKTKKELFHFALQNGCFIAPVNTAEDILKSPQFQSRGFWIEVEHPELGEPIKYPGFPYLFSESPCRVRRRPPLIGEHNYEVFCKELGFTQQELVMLKSAGIV